MLFLVGCGVQDSYYRADEIIARRDKEIEREVKKYSTVKKKKASPQYYNNYQKKNIKVNKDGYYALVIGIDIYPHFRDLESATNDARSMAYLLNSKYGFSTKLLTNPTRQKILRAFSYYRESLDYNDKLLIYYAGHGWLDKDADEGYWLPTDATKESEAFWISNSTITASIRAMKCKHILIISDSCYSGKLARGVNIIPSNNDEIEILQKKKARVVLTSGGIEPVFDTGINSKHSVFADALIGILNENQGVLITTELFTKLRRKVLINSDQAPEYSDIRKAGHDGGDFIFIRSK